MAASPDRFLGRNSQIETTSPLGRVFNVTRETWGLTEDPIRQPPRTERVVTARTASEAADLARAAAAAFPRHGFHKPSGAWWGANSEWFHRFAVHAGRRERTTNRPSGPLAAAAVAGLAVVAVLGLSWRRRGGSSKS